MILRHTLTYTSVKIFPAIASMLTLMVFTRLMTPQQFGEYSLTVNVTATVVAVLGNFLVLGLGRFEAATNTNADKQRLHSTVIASAVFISAGVAILTMLLAAFGVLPDLSVNYYFFVVLFSLSLLLVLSQKLINANMKPKAYGLSLALRNILLLFAGAACLLTGYGVYGVLTSLAIGSFLASLPALNLWSRISWRSFDLEVLRQLWSYGAPLTLLYLFVMIISFSDRIFIDVMLGGKEVGLYSAGYDLTQFSLALVASIVHLAAFPIILKSYESEGEEKARELMAISLKVLLLVILPVTLGFIATRKDITIVFLGNDFIDTSIMLIPPLALSIFLSSVKSYYFDYAFQIKKSTRLQLIPPLIAAAANCIFNYILIRAIGVVGATYATLISYFIYLTLTVILSKKVFKFPPFPWKYAIKISLSSFIMMMIVSWLQINSNAILSLFFKIIIGISIFLICIILLTKKELLILKEYI